MSVHHSELLYSNSRETTAKLRAQREVAQQQACETFRYYLDTCPSKGTSKTVLLYSDDGKKDYNDRLGSTSATLRVGSLQRIV